MQYPKCEICPVKKSQVPLLPQPMLSAHKFPCLQIVGDGGGVGGGLGVQIQFL